LPDVKAGLDLFGIAWTEIDDAEADDVIATVRVLSPGRRPGQRLLGPAHVHDRFGIPPERYPDLRALCGDSSDNIPGVRGIGLKTAAALLAGGLGLAGPARLRAAGRRGRRRRPRGLATTADLALNDPDAHRPAAAPAANRPTHNPTARPRRSHHQTRPVVARHTTTRNPATEQAVTPATSTGLLLAVMAHPDDAELWAGGTLAAHAAHAPTGIAVAAQPPRDAEAAAGAATLGAWLHRLDRLDSDTIGALLTQLRPDIVITHPLRDMHPDHRHTAKSLLAALPSTVTATGHPKRAYSCDTYNSLTLDGPVAATAILDVTATFPTKMAAKVASSSRRCS